MENTSHIPHITYPAHHISRTSHIPHITYPAHHISSTSHIPHHILYVPHITYRMSRTSHIICHKLYISYVTFTSDHWVAGSNTRRGVCVIINLTSLSLAPAWSQFSLSNMHKIGLKQHHLILSVPHITHSMNAHGRV